MLARVHDEQGAIVITAAVLAVGFILLGSGIIQVGDWLQHRRHLQVRADAAALAGGQIFGECFDPIDYSTAQAQTDIENVARRYAGFAIPGGDSYNGQIGGGSDSVVFQSSKYSDGAGGDDTQSGVAECANLSLDVKLTDSGIPALFAFAPLGTTHAHARVELQSIKEAKGLLPLAVPDNDPKQVGVTFVDETNGGTELTGCSGASLLPGSGCTFLLAKGSPASGVTPWSASAGVKIPATPGHLLGARVGLGGQVASCAGVDGTANASCWDVNNVNRGLVTIRVYAGGGNGAQPNPPVLHAVTPTSSCSGSPFFSDTSLPTGVTSCTAFVQASVDFGTGSTDPTRPKSGGGVGARLTATVNGQTVTLSPASYDATSGDWLWSGSTAIAVDASGSTSGYPVALAWEETAGTFNGKTCKTTNGNPCTGSFGTVARLTSATDGDDGPVKVVSLSEPSSPLTAPYSLTSGLHTLTVTIGLAPALGVQSPPKLIALRLTGTGSRTTGVNCDGTGNSDFTNAIVGGCKTPYQINDNDVCPDPAAPAGAPDCVPLKTGNLGSTVPTALNQRFGNTCPAATDPARNLLLMLTDPSALSGSGKTTIPVINFADFRVVGWTGGPGTCGQWPFPGSEPSGGNIWGYFLKYDAPGQQSSGEKCRVDEITPCVAVLTR